MLEQLAAAGVLDLAVSGGEPLLRSDVPDLIARAVRLGLRTGLGSNGSTLNPDLARRLRRAGLHRIQISIDGTEATHDAIRRWSGLHRRAWTAIELCRAAGLRVHVCFTVQRSNRAELGAVLEACAAGGVARLNVSRFVPTGRGVPGDDLEPGEWRDVVRETLAYGRTYAGRVEVATHLAQLVLEDDSLGCVVGFSGCQAGRGQGCIGPEGDVYPCVLLPVPIGSIRRTPFAQLWGSSPVIAALRVRDGLGPRCAGCSVREWCGGCRAVAYAYRGDYLADDPRCWRDGQVNPSSGCRQKSTHRGAIRLYPSGTVP